MGRIGIGLAAVPVAVAALAVPAHADAPVPASQGWVAYGADFTLGDNRYDMVTGKTVGPQQCDFSESLKLPAGQAAIEKREVAFNPNTCQSVVETGVPPLDVVEGDAAALRARGAARISRAQAVDARTQGAVAAGRVRSAGYLKSDYEDPVQVDVNSVRNNTDWRWNGRRVFGPVRSARAYGWFSESGWELGDNNWHHYFTKSQTTSSSYANFHNDIFCRAAIGPIFGRTTHIHYDRNTVHGRGNGDLVGVVHARKSGGCTWLLHFEHRLVRTLN